VGITLALAAVCGRMTGKPEVDRSKADSRMLGRSSAAVVPMLSSLPLVSREGGPTPFSYRHRLGKITAHGACSSIVEQLNNYFRANKCRSFSNSFLPSTVASQGFFPLSTVRSPGAIAMISSSA